MLTVHKAADEWMEMSDRIISDVGRETRKVPF